MPTGAVTTRIYPAGILDTLSPQEVERLHDASRGNLAMLLRRCTLAVLHSGTMEDDAEALLDDYRDFDLRVEQVNRGLCLHLFNAPEEAFVDGQIIEGIRQQLSAVMRDLVYSDTEIGSGNPHDLETSSGTTNSVFEILRNAGALVPNVKPDLVVCWGGHSISTEEYQYSKECGYQLGLRKLNIVTGCGPGAMKGPMKGASISHLKQRMEIRRYVGISEPSIIAAESPNTMVNELIIMPDIEKRLEAFIRLGHGVIVFPGGVGTAEEILYLMGILMDPANSGMPFPVVMTGPESSQGYFRQIDDFIRLTLGSEVCSRYRIIIDDPVLVAKTIHEGLKEVRNYRRKKNDAFHFNWRLRIDEDLQRPFVPSHENMKQQAINPDLPAHQLAANLRRVFSGIVAGNIKPDGIERVRKHGNFPINGNPEIMELLDLLLENFIKEGRMKLPGKKAYKPCYDLFIGPK